MENETSYILLCLLYTSIVEPLIYTTQSRSGKKENDGDGVKCKKHYFKN